MRYLVFVVLFSVIVSLASFTKPSQNQDPKLFGKELYLDKCKACHGKNGSWTLMANRLTESKLSLEESIERITEGKGKMPAYKERLTAEQIRSLAEYIQVFKEGNE